MAGNLAPWCKNEKWEFGTFADGRRWAKVTGRERAPKELTSNWAWRLRNDYEEQLPGWYHGPDTTIPGYDGPPWDQKKRETYWLYLRNPLRNGGLFTWGWADRNYTVTVDEGDPDPMTTQRNDKTNLDGTPQQGYQKATLTANDGSGEVRKWVSFCSPKLVWYSGTQPTGFYGFKLNPLFLKF